MQRKFKHVPYVIGMSQAIKDQAAIEFAVGFYDALGAGEAVEFAFESGLVAMQLSGASGNKIPVLIKGRVKADPEPAEQLALSSTSGVTRI